MISRCITVIVVQSAVALMVKVLLAHFFTHFFTKVAELQYKYNVPYCYTMVLYGHHPGKIQGGTTRGYAWI